MATTFNYAMGDVKPDQLQREINDSVIFTVTCIGVSVELDTDVIIEFNADLSPAEETELGLVVNDHEPDIDQIDVTALPLSAMDGKKLAVHTSYKPFVPDTTTFATWTGSGDDIDNDIIGGGQILHLKMVPGQATTIVQVRFIPAAGRVWLHEGYLRFVNAGENDYMGATIMAPASALQPAINLDLVLDGTLVKYSQSGPGTGTHGFAATPTLIPRTFSKDGDWDYDASTSSLTPNFSGTGGYQIKTEITGVHRYINKIPCYGTCGTYFSMSSDETTELRYPYYLEIMATNVSDTTWHASVLMEIYREKTI